MAIAATILFWASAFAAIRVALKVYSPTEVAFLRYVTASIALIIYPLLKKIPLPRSVEVGIIAFGKDGLLQFLLETLLVFGATISIST